MEGPRFTQESLETSLGAAGSRLPRLPRAKQLQLRKWLASQEACSLTPELRLRASIASGRPVEATSLVSSLLARTFPVEDLLRFSTRLSTKKGLVDSTAFLHASADSIHYERPATRPQDFRRISGGLQKWSRWVLSQKASLSEATAIELASILSLLAGRLPAPKRPSRGAAARSTALLKQLLSIAKAVILTPPTVELCTRNLGIVLGVRLSCREQTLTELLEAQGVADWVGWLVRGVRVSIEDLATRGNADKLSEISSQCGAHPRLEEAAKGAARSVLERQAGILSADVQRWLQRYLGILRTTPAVQVEHVSAANRPEISQLALALLRAWDARADSRNAGEAYDTLKDVCDRFFNLRLGGDVGATVQPDSRLFQIDGESRPEGGFVLRRPWAECRDADTWRIVIRGVISRA